MSYMKITREKKEVIVKTIGELKVGEIYSFKGTPYMKIDTTIREKKEEPEVAEPVDVKDVEKAETEAAKGLTYSIVVSLETGRCRKVSDILKAKVIDTELKIKE